MSFFSKIGLVRARDSMHYQVVQRSHVTHNATHVPIEFRKTKEKTEKRRKLDKKRNCY